MTSGRKPALVGLVAAAAALCTAPAASASAPARTTTVRAHPRILLDRATLTTLRARARRNTTEWRALRTRCDELTRGPVEFPDGRDYPDPGVGEGYQGDTYAAAVLDLGLCFQTIRFTAKPSAARYASTGRAVLDRMSRPSGPHAVDVLRDSGYGIRNFGIGMAIGYDWLHPMLGPRLRAQVRRAIARWVTGYEKGGFGRDHPQGNYFAGYYAAKAYAGFALEGEDPFGGRTVRDWLTRVHARVVRPYYASNLSGGGWPEGWNYGPNGTLNMTLPILAARTAKGLNLSARFPYARNAPRFLMHFLWPNRRTLDDSSIVDKGDDPSGAPRWLFTAQAGIAAALGTPFAPVVRSYAEQVRRATARRTSNEFDHWIDFLFWPVRSARRAFTTQPVAYRARGSDKVAMRSSWGTDAVWAAFYGGPHTNNPDAGHEFFDKGALSIVNRGRPFLVNAYAALVRNTPGTDDGAALNEPAYNDVHGDASTRGLFDVFYVGRPTPTGQEAVTRRDGNRTHLTAFESSAARVHARAEQLEDNYPRARGARTIRAWTRDLLYTRPGTFRVEDRTSITSAAIDQWMAFHFAQRPIPVPGQAPGVSRYDIGSGVTYAGSVFLVAPAQRDERIVDVLDSHKVFRLEVRPASPATHTTWVTVFSAAASPADASAG